MNLAIVETTQWVVFFFVVRVFATLHFDSHAITTPKAGKGGHSAQCDIISKKNVPKLSPGNEFNEIEPD
jgi:hypothetical protein